MGERFFMIDAEAVANSLDAHDLEVESVVPDPAHIRDVAMNVAVAVVLEAQKSGIATVNLGKDKDEVQSALRGKMWIPHPKHRRMSSVVLPRVDTDFGMGQR